MQLSRKKTNKQINKCTEDINHTHIKSIKVMNRGTMKFVSVVDRTGGAFMDSVQQSNHEKIKLSL